MKLQKLTIHNLASIEDAVIDFSEPPLADSDVFLITGKTGAGKSTILDAICLALYNKTPRLYDTKMQGETRDGLETAIDDPRQLLRQNTGEGFSSLSFTGSNDVRYEARWIVRRAHNKAGNKLRPKEWELTNLDSGHVLNKDKDIEPAIREAVGLDFKQFCRTTMLAQGEFTRFLNSSDNDKAAILEKITGVDIYSKIGAKVYAIAAEKERDAKMASQRVDDIHTMSDEDIAAKESEINNLTLQSKQLSTTIADATARRDWLLTDQALALAETKARADYDAAKAVVEGDEFKHKDTFVKQWKETIEARGWLTEKQKAEDIQNSQENILNRLSDQYATLLGGIAYARQKTVEAESQIKEIDCFLEQEKDKAEVYQNEQTIVGHLKAIADGRSSIDKENEKVKQAQANLETHLCPALKCANEKVEATQKEFDQLSGELAQQDQALTALRLPDLREQQKADIELLHKLSVASVQLDNLDTTRVRIDAWCQRLADNLAALNNKKTFLEQKKPPLHDAEIAMNAQKAVLDKQRDTVDKFATAMRAKLAIGDTCPVCGQPIVAALPHESALATLLNDIEAQYNEARCHHQQLADDMQRLLAEIKADQAAYSADKERLDNDVSLSKAVSDAQKTCADCGIPLDCDNPRQHLCQLQQQTQLHKADTDARLRTGDAIEAAVSALRLRLRQQQATLDDAKHEQRSAEKLVADCTAAINGSAYLVETKTNEINAATTCAAQLITAGTWATDWHTHPARFAQQLSAAAVAYNDHVSRRKKLHEQCARANAYLSDVDNVAHGIVQTMPLWESATPATPAKTDNLLAAATDLRTAVAAAAAMLHTAHVNINSADKHLSDFLSAHHGLTLATLMELNQTTPDEVSRLENWQGQVRSRLLAAETTFNLACQRTQQHHAVQPSLAEFDTADSLTAAIDQWQHQQSDTNIHIGRLSQDLDNARRAAADLASLLQEKEQALAAARRWARLKELLGDASGDKFRKIAQSYILANLIHTANHYMRTLADRYTLAVLPGTFVINLQDAYQGYASRPATTLSGGESFLLSLSLALALGDIGQAVTVDTLFIDEGFGTLSGQPLQQAVGTLRTLRTKAGRHVGIISHVEELGERIPVQIRVSQPAGSPVSTVSICGPEG